MFAVASTNFYSRTQLELQDYAACEPRYPGSVYRAKLGCSDYHLTAALIALRRSGHVLLRLWEPYGSYGVLTCRRHTGASAGMLTFPECTSMGSSGKNQTSLRAT